LLEGPSLYVGVPGLQDTDSGTRAHLGRGYEPIGGANSLTPHSVIFNFYFGNYLFRSLAAQGPKKIFTEKHPTYSGPPGGCCQRSRDDYHLVVGHRRRAS
jgi:hypothetical protein